MSFLFTSFIHFPVRTPRIFSKKKKKVRLPHNFYQNSKCVEIPRISWYTLFEYLIDTFPNRVSRQSPNLSTACCRTVDRRQKKVQKIRDQQFDRFALLCPSILLLMCQSVDPFSSIWKGPSFVVMVPANYFLSMETSWASINEEPWNLPSRHYIAPCLFASCPCRASITPTRTDIVSCIWVQKSTATDQYISSYGPASFDFKTRHRNIKLRRAEAPSISVRCRRFLCLYRDPDVVYILMYTMEPKVWYWWRYGSAGFCKRNQPCLHTYSSNFIETW